MTDWTQEEAEVPGDNTHLWEESWDDDDTNEDFSAQLKYVPPSYHHCSHQSSRRHVAVLGFLHNMLTRGCREELKKVEAAKKR